MVEIIWKDETYKPEYPRFTAYIGTRRVAFVNYIPPNKEYSYHHSLVKMIDTPSNFDFKTLDKCKEHVQRILNEIISYAKTRQLIWFYPNPNKKECFLIFQNSNIALANVREHFLEDEEYNPTEVQDGYDAYLFLFSVDDVIHKFSYADLKNDVLMKITGALAELAK